MKRMVLFVLLLSVPVCCAQEFAVFTVVVSDLYGKSIDDARVSVNYVYPRPEDADILDQFTQEGIASFQLEADREYVVTVTKAGFLPHTEMVELEKDKTLKITLEYQQRAPVLHVKRYSITPEIVQPGEHFQLHLVVENEGTDDALTMKVTFGSSQLFSPVQPSSSAYFERLDVGDSASVSQTFAVSGDVVSGVYDLVVTISYKDAIGMLQTVQGTIGITVLRKPLIKLLNVDYPAAVEEGVPFTFSVDVANTGRFAVNGLYLEVESDMDWEYSSYYIGSLEAGDFDTFVSDVLPTAGEHTFVITVGFVDDFNKEHSQKESFSVTVKEITEKETPPPQKEKGLWQRFIEFLKAFLGLD